VILLAWVDHDMFDCGTCNENQKRANGCTDKPRDRKGQEVAWEYPPDKPEVFLDTCPANVIMESPDVVEVFRCLNLAGSSVSVLDQQEIPPPYLEALTLANYHQSARTNWAMRQQSQKAKARRG
jgi:cystathionine beta-lyase/cystathionine gamma-synthase